MARRSLYAKRKTLYSSRKTTAKAMAKRTPKKSVQQQQPAYDEDDEVDDFTDVPQHIQLTLQYTITSQGLLVLAETGGAMALLLVYVFMTRYMTDSEWYAHGIFLVAFTYALNDLLVIISALSSPSTQMHLPRTTFYALYHCFGGISYGFTGVLVYMFGNDISLPYALHAGMTGLGLSLVHFIHTIINVLLVLSLEPD
ncbi:uncharacterized protein LOC125944749 [Dermacentor silvarum]|uniref:uncharacterized protein LOC125944749 n=1 Tax=Dermacentor silvarum TaxID=543639 RepID=UPI00210183FD|nr:uncharacterized protein LOC125944749 [Dermacentor silvarum]